MLVKPVKPFIHIIEWNGVPMGGMIAYIALSELLFYLWCFWLVCVAWASCSLLACIVFVVLSALSEAA